MLLNELKSYHRSLRVIPNASFAFQRNRLKEYLHLYTLDFLYKHPKFRGLIFYGGTCLRHCFQLPRLSEDLDFEWLDGEFSFSELSHSLSEHFRSQLDFDALQVRQQKFRLYLKFPILKELGLADSSQSDFLQVKIEINETNHPKGSFETEIQPIFAHQRTFYLLRYDLETLMASKINAVLSRTWTKVHKDQSSTSDVKGRDYFDLLWYMEKRIKPKLAFTSFSSEEELWKELQNRVQAVSERSLELDLVDFLDSPTDAKEFALNFKAAFQTLSRQYI